MNKSAVESPSNVDKQALRRLYRSDKAAKALLDHLAGRERNWGEEVDVDRLAAKVEVPRPDVVRALKAFEEVGLGRYISGRRGLKSRFRRYVDLLVVARYASGQAGDIDEVSLAAASEDEALDATGALSDVSRNGSSDLTHRFQLRPDAPISFDLPRDLTSSEADRLANYIRTLPFS
jgi:DNA-binding MarR family transcriptional regulator